MRPCRFTSMDDGGVEKASLWFEGRMNRAKMDAPRSRASCQPVSGRSFRIGASAKHKGKSHAGLSKVSQSFYSRQSGMTAFYLSISFIDPSSLTKMDCRGNGQIFFYNAGSLNRPPTYATSGGDVENTKSVV